MEVIDLPLIGRKYTWIRGKSCSRLDIMLVKHEWMVAFLDLKLWALGRSMSDHCPLVLETEKIDWGLKPYRSIDTWFSHPEFINIIKKE